MKLKFQHKIILNYIMVHAKENLNLAFTTTRNHFEIDVIKRSFQSTFGNEGRIPKNIFACLFSVHNTTCN